jgi:hypothetical protein
MATRREFYDWPPRRRPRVEEILPPEPNEVRFVPYRRRSPQHWVLWAAMFALVLILWRAKFMLLLLAVMGGNVTVAIAGVVLLLAIVAWREHRAGRPF